jgi:hypothetical protein
MDLSGRVALCLSGQIRTGVENAPAIMRYLGEFRGGIDVFIHTWNIETESPWTEKNKGDVRVANIRRPVDHSTILKISELYRPLDMRVDDFDIYQKCHHDRVTFRTGLCVAQIPMFQSIWESNQLKLNHERLSSSRYDVTVRMRFDLDFGPGRTLLEDLHYMAGKKDFLYFLDFSNKFPESIEDVCWISSSETMDVACEFALERESNIEKNGIDWQNHMMQYLKDKGIIYRPFKNNSVTIHRNNFIED